MYRKRHTLIFVWSLLLFCGYGDLLQALENETELDTKLDQLAEEIAVQIPDAVKYIAIVDFAKEDKKVITPFGRYIATVLMQRLLKYGNLKIMKREELEAVIREYEIEMTDFFDPQTMKRLGKFRGVDAILTGTYWNFGTYIQMIATLTDMESANPVLSTRKPISSKWVPDEYIDTDQRGDNRPPVWYPQGEPTNQTIIPGEMYELDLSAADPDRDPLVYSVTPIPTGATFDSQTQLFAWRPTKAQHGRHQLTFSVDDRHGGVLSNQVTFTINSPPKLKINDVSIRPGQDFDFYISAQDDDGDSLIYGMQNLPNGADFNPENGRFLWRNSKRGKFDVTFYVQDPYSIDEKKVRLIVTEPLSIIKGKTSQWVSDGKIELRVSNVRSGFYSNIDFQIRNPTQRLVSIGSVDTQVYDSSGGYQKAIIFSKESFNINPGGLVTLQAPSVESPSALLLTVAMADGEYSGIYLIDISDNTGGWNPIDWNYIPTTEIEQEGRREFPDHRSDFSTIRKSISAKLGERIATIQAKAWASQWDDPPVLIETRAYRFALYQNAEPANQSSYLLADAWAYTYRCRGHWVDVVVSYNHIIQAKQYDEGHVGGLDVEMDLGKWRIDDIEVMDILHQRKSVFRGGAFQIATWQINKVPTLIWTIPFRVNGVDFVIDAQTGDLLVPLEDPLDNPNTPWTKYDDTNRR